MRLIDADGMTEGRVENDPVVIAAKCAPTAYDPDKVVEQLKDVSYERFGYAGMGGENVVNLDDAIEIVKAGGENE
jgi:hypothetical protein